MDAMRERIKGACLLCLPFLGKMMGDIDFQLSEAGVNSSDYWSFYNSNYISKKLKSRHTSAIEVA